MGNVLQRCRIMGPAPGQDTNFNSKLPEKNRFFRLPSSSSLWNLPVSNGHFRHCQAMDRQAAAIGYPRVSFS